MRYFTFFSHAFFLCYHITLCGSRAVFKLT